MTDKDLKGIVEMSPWEREQAACKAWEEAESPEEREAAEAVLETIAASRHQK